MGKISDRLWKRAGEQKIPLTGAFELLPTCNLQCKMCYIRKRMTEVNEAGGLLPTEFWLEKAKEAAAQGLLYPLLTGGEPFLRQDLYQLVAGMQKMGLQVSINSNGTLIDEAAIDWLKRYKPLRINLTLYGSSEDTYARLCGNGEAYGKVRKAVELLKQNEIPLKFNTSITNENVGDLEEIIAFAKSVNSPIQAATYMFPPLRRDRAMVGENARLLPEEAGLARVKADFLQNEPEWFLGQAARFKHFVPLDELDIRQAETEKMHCRAGRCSFWLDWQGNLGNCGMYLTAGISLKTRDFKSAWEQVCQETELFTYMPDCSGCPNKSLCHTCAAMVYNECGSRQGRPEYLCRMNEAAAKYYQEYAKKYDNRKL